MTTTADTQKTYEWEANEIYLTVNWLDDSDKREKATIMRLRHEKGASQIEVIGNYKERGKDGVRLVIMSIEYVEVPVNITAILLKDGQIHRRIDYPQDATGKHGDELVITGVFKGLNATDAAKLGHWLIQVSSSVRST